MRTSVLFLPHLRLGSPPFPDPVGPRRLSRPLRCMQPRRAVPGPARRAGARRRPTSSTSCGACAGGVEPSRILAIGGSTRNPLLMRLKASLYGRPVEAAEMPDATCLGAALLGGLAAGLFPDLDEPPAPASPRWSAAAWRRTTSWPLAQRRQRVRTYGEVYAAAAPASRRCCAIRLAWNHPPPCSFWYMPGCGLARARQGGLPPCVGDTVARAAISRTAAAWAAASAAAASRSVRAGGSGSS